MLSAVSGLTKHDAPWAGSVPSGRARDSEVSTQRYSAYVAPPMMATVRPSSARAASDEPVATTTPAPSLPTGIDWPLRAARPRIVCGGIVAVTTGFSAVPDSVAVSRSAVDNSNPRSDGLIGAASIRTSTSFASGSGTSTEAMDSSNFPSGVISDRICRIVRGSSFGMCSSSDVGGCRYPTDGSLIARALPEIDAGVRRIPVDLGELGCAQRHVCQRRDVVVELLHTAGTDDE